MTALYESGHSLAQVWTDIGTTARYAQYYLERAGVKFRQKWGAGRTGRAAKKLTPGALGKVKALNAAGFSIVQIAAKTGYTYHQVRGLLLKINGPADAMHVAGVPFYFNRNAEPISSLSHDQAVRADQTAQAKEHAKAIMEATNGAGFPRIEGMRLVDFHGSAHV
jgi:hypothetical protein